MCINPDKYHHGAKVFNDYGSHSRYRYYLSIFPRAYSVLKIVLQLSPSRQSLIVAVSNIAAQAGTPAVPKMDSTLHFQTKRCLQLEVPFNSSCLLDTKFSSDQTLPYIEVTSDMDMEHFKTLKEGHGKNELILF